MFNMLAGSIDRFNRLDKGEQLAESSIKMLLKSKFELTVGKVVYCNTAIGDLKDV